jgi:hypothetical protein
MKTQIKNRPTQVFPKGTLLLCDPCYFFDNDNIDHTFLWSNLVDQMFDPKNPGGAYGEISQRGVAEIVLDNGKIVPFLYMGTAHGDGVYDFTTCNVPRMGSEIGVDAGLICAIRVEDLANFNRKFDPAAGGRVIPDFEGEVEILDRGVMEGKGKGVYFSINTDEDEEEDYDYEDDYDSEDF